MEEPHRAVQRHLARAHPDHLAAHAAQVGQIVARGEPAAVNDDCRPVREPIAVLAEADFGA